MAHYPQHFLLPPSLPTPAAKPITPVQINHGIRVTDRDAYLTTVVHMAGGSSRTVHSRRVPLPSSDRPDERRSHVTAARRVADLAALAFLATHGAPLVQDG